ncbi:MAG: mechanosensitive ion channel, partial [Deltaproteobacteria bacterium]|nr:mechanosensitive ion channel [Deltaproteobacteria bacterium]
STRAPVALLAGALALTFATLDGATAQQAASGVESAPVAEAESMGKAEESSRTQATLPKSSPREISDAERILKMEQTIESERERQAQLEGEQQAKKTEFNELTEELKDLGARLAAEKKRLEAIEADSEEAAELQNQIEPLEQEYALVMQHADLALRAGRILGEQTRRLKQKIAQDSQVLERLRGTESAEARADAGDEAAAAEQPEAAPSAPPAPAEQAPQSQAASSPERRETAEQIEARREVEQKVAEAKRAEQAVVEYVERKQTLQEQIALAKQLIDTDEQSQDNAFELLHRREAGLEAQIQAGAKPAELQASQREVRRLQGTIEKLAEVIESRTERLSELHEQLHTLQEEQLLVIQGARLKREEAEAARRRSAWFESPLHPHNITHWVVTRGPSILVMLAAIVALFATARIATSLLARMLVRPAQRGDAARAKRVETIAVSFGGAARIIIVMVGALLLLEEAGVNIRTVLGGAAVLGLAVAFGAQNLMRDYFSGFMILLEDQYELGDLVSIGEVTGIVERANMRTTVLRDLEGRTHFIPNGQITRVTNRSYGWARAVFEISVAFHEDVDRVMVLLMELAREMRKDENYGPDIIDEPLMLGVDDFGDAAVVIKFMMKTKPDKMFPVRREMLRRIKNRFEQEGIEIPIPKRMIVQQPANDT